MSNATALASRPTTTTAAAPAPAEVGIHTVALIYAWANVQTIRLAASIRHSGALQRYVRGGE